MSVFSFVSSLLPKFGKSRLKEDINIVTIELKNTVLPCYEQATPLYGANALQTKEAKDFSNQWFKYVPNTNKNHGLVVSISKKLELAINTCEQLNSFIDKEFEDTVIVSGITINKAATIRILEVLSFISTYAMKFLNYLYVIETKHLGGVAKSESELTPGEINLIKTHFVEFCTAVKALCNEKAKPINKRLESVPEILVNAHAPEAIAATGASYQDVMGVFNVRGFTYNPIYHISMFIAEWQANKYKRNKELKTILEMRLLQMQQAQQGNFDPTLDKEISITQSRIEKLDKSLREFEEEINA